LITAERWYDANPDLTNFNQGDVIKDIPYAFWPQAKPASETGVWGVLRPLEPGERSLKEVLNSLPNKLVGRAEKDVPDAWKEPEGEFVIAGCKKMNVMIISRSCALDNPKRKHFLVAPVLSILSLPEPQRSPGKLEELRKNGIPHFFYLPAHGDLAESYADLLRMEPIHRSFFEINILKSHLLARLSATATDALQMDLSDHFGTQFGFSEKDICPQAGEYRCSNCFHEGMEAEKTTFEAGTAFGQCKRCGEAGAWVKMPQH
jgi:hypothetical protein